MIGGVTRHGRTKRDAQLLAAHLLKDAYANVVVLNSIAPDLKSAMSDMLMMKESSKAESAFLHMHLSPSTEMSDAQLRKIVSIVLRHFDAQDHPACFVIHEKDRLGGDGDRHVHLVLGRLGYDGDVIKSGFEKIRLETAVRVAEFEMGENPILGRHHKSSLKWLRANGRDDVADWLEAAHGHDPIKPMSPATPAKRQALERAGVKLPIVRKAVRDAWSTTADVIAFERVLLSKGLVLEPGRKDCVWIVRQGLVEIGSLDRILKLKRSVVSARMSSRNAVPAYEEAPKPEQKSKPNSRRHVLVRDIDGRIDLDGIRRRSEIFGCQISETILDFKDAQALKSAIRAKTAKKEGSHFDVQRKTLRRPTYDPSSIEHKYVPTWGRRYDTSAIKRGS